MRIELEGSQLSFFFSMIFEIQDSLLYWSWRTDQLPSISFLFIQVSHEFTKKLWIVSPVGRHQQNCLICKVQWVNESKSWKLKNFSTFIPTMKACSSNFQISIILTLIDRFKSLWKRLLSCSRSGVQFEMASKATGLTSDSNEWLSKFFFFDTQKMIYKIHSKNVSSQRA